MPGDNLVPFQNAINNLPTIEEQLRTAFASSGVDLPESFIFDREIHRYGHKTRCWYVLFDDGIKGGAWATWTTVRCAPWWRWRREKTFRGSSVVAIWRALGRGIRPAD